MFPQIFLLQAELDNSTIVARIAGGPNAPGARQTFLLAVQNVFIFAHLHIALLYCKSLPFFYFLTFEKGRLLYIHPVGRLVGWLVDVTINFFNI